MSICTLSPRPPLALSSMVGGRVLRAGHHVGQTEPLLPAAPPALEQTTSARGRCVLVNIIGRWCVKLTVLVRTPKATPRIKLNDLRPEEEGLTLRWVEVRACVKWGGVGSTNGGIWIQKKTHWRMLWIIHWLILQLLTYLFCSLEKSCNAMLHCWGVCVCVSLCLCALSQFN